jgi:hypothetical protein
MSQADNRDTTKLSRRSALAGLAGAAAAGITPAIAATEPDPIFDAIKYERDCYAEYGITSAITSKISDQCPTPMPIRVKPYTAAHVTWWADYQKAEAVNTAAAKKWYEAQELLLETQPTSKAGLIAFLNHLDAHCDADKGWVDEWALMAFPSIASAVLELIGGEAAQAIA